MIRKGEIKYELSEQEHNQATYAIECLDRYLNTDDSDDYIREEAENGVRTLKEIFELEND